MATIEAPLNRHSSQFAENNNRLATRNSPRQNVPQMQHKEAQMKTASMPSLRVDPQLRQDAESVLQQGETLSSFMEQALRTSIQSRKFRQDFIARGLASRYEARKTGEYFAADEVLSEMEALLVKSDSRTRR
jgi:predicted transcriptional regulator